jgi:hypothetical protein
MVYVLRSILGRLRTTKVPLSLPSYSRSFLPNGCENPAIEQGDSRDHVEKELLTRN